MKKYLLWLVLLPIIGKAQYYDNQKPNLSFVSSLEVGMATYHTNVLETALLIGLQDNNELNTLELGYVYKRILNSEIGHNANYHGIRGAIEIRLFNTFGTYGTYDIIKGKRWLYDDVSANVLKVYTKIHGEGTLGIFFAPKESLLKFYAGIEPYHYDPSKVKRGLTPHRSSSINLKFKYTLSM
jgi:hypothetical protein